jgi:hypothetical protein
LSKTKWDKSEVLLGTSCPGGTTWGTFWEHILTYWEQGKKQKKFLTCPKKEKNNGPCMLSLLIWLHEAFYFQNCLSPFLAWPQTLWVYVRQL